jgi:TPR repeat protein
MPRPAELSRAERERTERLVAQGEQYLAQGKVGGARLFFRQAADAGLALAAIRLGATYDPAELSRLQVQGITPDAGEARKWYERARELGAPEAEERLARPAH